jgi:transposase-like protein
MRKHAKTITRSRRKRRHRDPMKHATKTSLPDGRPGIQVTLPFDPGFLLQEAVEQLATEIGLTVMTGLLEDEAEQLAGPRHAKGDGKAIRRHGYEESSVTFAGKKLAILRPRLRDAAGEVALTRLGQMRSPGPLRETMARHVLAQVATRRYAGVVDTVAEGFGIQRSSVSRHWKAASAQELEKLVTRSLAGLDLVVVMLDSVHFQDHAMIVGLGIALDGRKHILGLWEGSSENTTLVTSLLTDLVSRGLATGVRRLFVLDGAKALRKGVVSVFGDEAIIQRCLIHKKRNVLDHLPENLQWTAGKRLSAAWGMNDYAAAKAAIEDVCAWLKLQSAPAEASLREGLEDTLTLHRLGVPPELRIRLNTTNAIENVFSTLRHQLRRVRNWSSAPDMRRRWVGTGLIESEKRFHRLKNHGLLPQLANLLNNPAHKTLVA